MLNSPHRSYVLCLSLLRGEKGLFVVVKSFDAARYGVCFVQKSCEFIRHLSLILEVSVAGARWSDGEVVPMLSRLHLGLTLTIWPRQYWMKCCRNRCADGSIFTRNIPFRARTCKPSCPTCKNISHLVQKTANMMIAMKCSHPVCTFTPDEFTTGQVPPPFAIKQIKQLQTPKQKHNATTQTTQSIHSI